MFNLGQDRKTQFSPCGNVLGAGSRNGAPINIASNVEAANICHWDKGIVSSPLANILPISCGSALVDEGRKVVVTQCKAPYEIGGECNLLSS